jgi:hypothetical protein
VKGQVSFPKIVTARAWVMTKGYASVRGWRKHRVSQRKFSIIIRSEIDAVAVGTSYAEVRAKLGAPSRGDPGFCDFSS